MESPRPTGTVLDAPAPDAAGRLYRLPEALYRKLRDRGLIPRDVSLRDGLLWHEGAPGGPEDRLYRMPLEVYERLGPPDGEGTRVELLDGLLVTRMTRGLPHFVATLLLWRVLERLAPAGMFVAKEDPVALPSGPSGHPSLPEPDVVVLRGSVRDYLDHRPGPDDVLLVVEVSDSTLREDRRKLARYAWEGIPSAWIVDLEGGLVEVHTGPSGPSESPGYGGLATFGRGQEVPVVLGGREVGRLPVVEILP